MRVSGFVLALAVGWIVINPHSLPPCGERVLLLYFNEPAMAWRYCSSASAMPGDHPIWLEPTMDRYIYEPRGATHWMPLPDAVRELPSVWPPGYCTSDEFCDDLLR